MSTAVIINGTAFPIRQEIAWDYDPENGFIFRQNYAGAGYNEMVQLANRFAAAGVKYEFSFTNAIAHLHTQDTSRQVAIDTWTIAQNEIAKTVLENPLIIAAMADEGGTTQQQLNRRIDIAKVQTGELDYDTVYNNFQALFFTGISSRLLQQVKIGSTDYAMSGYCLRHTTNVGNRYEANVADFNIDAIYTTAQLLSEVQNSFSWNFPLPGRLAYKIQYIVNDFISRYGTQANFQWGWLKRGSTETTAANNRVNITTEYWLDDWSTDRYGLAI